MRHKHLGVAGWLMDHGAKADVKDKVRRQLAGWGLCVGKGREAQGLQQGTFSLG